MCLVAVYGTTNSRNMRMSSIKNFLILLYKDNTTCLTQVKNDNIKRDRIKHILPKGFNTHELQKNGDIEVRQT